MDEKLETTTEPNARDVMEASVDALQENPELPSVAPTIPEPADNLPSDDAVGTTGMGESTDTEEDAPAPPVNVSDINFEESFINYLRYERNMSPETIRAYEKDLYQYVRFLNKRAGGQANLAARW